MVVVSDPIFSDETAARQYLEALRWPNGPVCPFCDRTGAVKPLRGASLGEGWYHCQACRKKFTVRVGTLYQRSHVPLHKWLAATHLICSPQETRVTSNMLRRVIGVSYKTAWAMKQRIGEAIDISDRKST